MLLVCRADSRLRVLVNHLLLLAALALEAGQTLDLGLGRLACQAPARHCWSSESERLLFESELVRCRKEVSTRDWRLGTPAKASCAQR
jgi:hypothetical protein